MIHNLGLIELPLNSIEWNGNADKKHFHSIYAFNDYKDKLKASIIKDGITKPPLVEWHLRTSPSASGKFRVKEGNHRCEIVSQLGWEKIKVNFQIVSYDNDWIVKGIKYLLGVSNG